MNDKRNNILDSILKGNFKYIVLGGALLLLLPIIFVFNTFSSENLNTGDPVTTNDTQQSNSVVKQPSNRTSPTKTVQYESVSDEKTAVESENMTFSNLSEIANDAAKQTRSDGSIVYTFASLHPNRTDVVIVKNGSIVFSRHAVVGKETSDKYKNLLSMQAKTISGPTFYGSKTVIYFYENGGTALIVDPQTDTTYEELTFQPPITLAEFNKDYKSYTQ